MQVKQQGRKIRILTEGVEVTIECRSEIGASVILYNLYREAMDCAVQKEGAEDGRKSR